MSHINNITNSVIKFLNFVRWNLAKCDKSVKYAAYVGLVRLKPE